MLPTRLNLLPPEKQSYLQRMVFVQFIKSMLETILFLLCLGGMGLLGGQWVLQNYFNDLTESTIGVSTMQDQDTLKIKEINAMVRRTKAIQAGYTLWTPRLAELGNHIPPGVTLQSYTINFQNKTFTFAGRAATRKDLLTLQESLESLFWIKTVNIPLSQLTQQENIAFSLTAELN